MNGTEESSTMTENVIDRDYEYVEVGTRRIKLTHVLFMFGLISLFLLFAYGSLYDDLDTQRILMYISVIAITVSILWGIRAKLYAVVLSFIILIVSYFVLGVILDTAGVVDETFSFGIITFSIIGVFVYWLNSDKTIGLDDIGKTALFLIVSTIINMNGWIGEANELVETAIQGGLPF